MLGRRVGQEGKGEAGIGDGTDARPAAGAVAELRPHRIRRVALALRRAGCRTEPPLPAEAHRWVFAVQVEDAEDGTPRSRPVWLPREEAEAWQRARFG